MYIWIVIPGQVGLSGRKKIVGSESGTKSVNSIPACSPLHLVS